MTARQDENSPERGTKLIPVAAFAISGIVAPADASHFFDAGAERVRVTKSLCVVKYSDSGWAVAHDFGAVVFVGVDALEQGRVVEKLRMRGGTAQSVTEETFRLELRAGAQAEVHTDRVVSDVLDEPLVELVGLVLGQSVAMEVFESEVEVLLGAIRHVLARLATSGRMSRPSRPLLRLIGRAMLTRNDVVHTLALLDTPLLVWNGDQLASIYTKLRAVFEIDDRYRALDHKIAMVQDNVRLVVDLTHQQRSLWLEVAVVVLIVFELVAPFVPGHGLRP